MAQFVDWDLAVATAQALGKAGPNASYEEAATAVADLRELAGQATDHVSNFTGLRVHSAGHEHCTDRKRARVQPQSYRFHLNSVLR